MVHVLLYPSIIFIDMPINLFVLCVMCLTVFTKQFAIFLGVVVIYCGMLW